MVDGNSHYADFAFRLVMDNSWLFIEDDDAQRAIGNAAKYWRWMTLNKIAVPVHLVHIIGPGLDSHKKLAAFICEQANKDHRQFKYYQILTENWEDKGWKHSFVATIGSIVK